MLLFGTIFVFVLAMPHGDPFAHAIAVARIDVPGKYVFLQIASAIHFTSGDTFTTVQLG